MCICDFLFFAVSQPASHVYCRCVFKPGHFTVDDDDELMLNVLRCHLTY